MYSFIHSVDMFAISTPRSEYVVLIHSSPEGDNIIPGDDVVPTLNLSLFFSAD